MGTPAPIVPRPGVVELALEARAGAVARRTVATRRTACLAALPSDQRHVIAVAANGHAALPPRLARFVRRELVRGALRMCSTSTLARDLALLRRVHRREAPVALGHVTGAGHR